MNVFKINEASNFGESWVELESAWRMWRCKRAGSQKFPTRSQKFESRLLDGLWWVSVIVALHLWFQFTAIQYTIMNFTRMTLMTNIFQGHGQLLNFDCRPCVDFVKRIHFDANFSALCTQQFQMKLLLTNNLYKYRVVVLEIQYYVVFNVRINKYANKQEWKLLRLKASAVEERMKKEHETFFEKRRVKGNKSTELGTGKRKWNESQHTACSPINLTWRKRAGVGQAPLWLPPQKGQAAVTRSTSPPS